MSLQVKPTRDNVFVSLLAEEQVLSSGLFVISRNDDKLYNRYKVESVSDNISLKKDVQINSNFVVGDIVWALKKHGTKVNVSGTEYTVLKESEIEMVEETYE